MAKKAAKKAISRTAKVKPATDVALVDLTPDEIRRLPKARDGFEAHAAALLTLYKAEAELRIQGLDTTAIETSLRALATLRALETSAAKQLEMIQETRLLQSSTAWSGLLKIYTRAQNVARTNAGVKRGIADFAGFMKNGPRKKKPTGG